MIRINRRRTRMDIDSSQQFGLNVFSKAIATPTPKCFSLGVGVAIGIGIDFLLQTYCSAIIAGQLAETLTPPFRFDNNR